MTRRFWRTFKVVAAVHVVVVIVLVVAGGLRAFRRDEEFVQPVEFLVEVPPSLVASPEESRVPGPVAPEEIGPPSPPSESKPEETELPERVKEPEPKPKPKPGPKPPIERSATPVVRRPDGKPPVAPLSEDEIRKLLDRGAKPSNRTVIPDDNNICFGLVRKAYYDAWIQPSRNEIGDASAEVLIRLGAGGTVVLQELKRPSGIAVLDSSVIAAAKQVRRIDGLTSDFISRHPTVTVLFRLE
jgi:outer membrane biosynthesis protein TonB